MLAGCQVLDLTDEKGFLCSKILADLGADVIKVERPGGDPSRRIGPFWHDVAKPEKSLYWWAYNSNKRGITLNLEVSDGKEIFKELTSKADFIIESSPPGHMEKLGIGYSVLSSIKKGIILVSITPFGQTGPYKDYKASDIVVMGMTGMLYLTGERESSPVNISIPQACLHASADAAVAAMIAYYHRGMTGEGQYVDISMQQSTALFLANTIPFWELSGTITKRAGVFRTGMSIAVVHQRQVWQCKDGYVFFVLLGGAVGARTGRQLTEWIESEGMDSTYLQTVDWDNFDMANVTQEVIDQISTPIEEFFLPCTKRELLEGAMKRGVSLCPLFSMENLLDDTTLKNRNFWVEIEHPELGASVSYPREFVKSSEKALSTRFRAPLIGEHNEEIYSEIGLSREDLVVLKQAGVV